MGRLIKTETAAKDRTRLSRAVVLALRELMHQAQPDQHSRDLAAFIALALQEIYETIDQSVAAWEKRGYWVKADRFRMEWEWSGRTAEKMKKALLENDWATVAMAAAQAAQKLMSVDVPVRPRLGTPWEGAWKFLKESEK